MSRKAVKNILILSVFMFATSLPGFVVADSAMVLPKGISMVGATLYNYMDITQVYDSSGNAEDLGAAYNRPLDSTVFTDLAGLDAFVGDGTATLGDAVVDFTRDYDWWEIYYSRGITDKLSLGIVIPYNFTKNNVSAYLNTSTADVGTNPAYLFSTFNISNPATYPIVPGGLPLDIDDIFALLGPGLDVDGNGSIEGPEPVGYGYDTIKNWSGSDLGDVELLAKYQVYNSKPWRMAVTGGLRLPTGTEDDPDNLMDVAPGDGQTDIIMMLHTDYLGLKSLFLNATLNYNIQLPGKATLRVPDDPDIPMTAKKEKCDRDLGDIIELELYGSYSISREWSLGLKYEYVTKSKDEIDGDLGYAYSSLEDGTDTTSHVGVLSVGYSTTQAYLDGDASIPFDVGLAYRNRFAGENGVTKSEYISLNFAGYF